MMNLQLNLVINITVLVPWLFKSVDATSCPTDRQTWEERAWNFTCVDNSIVYHCILDNTDRLVETCASRVPVPEGKLGCPVVRFRDNVAYHLDDNSECPPTNPACPSGKSAYYSDQLYLYPICFLNKDERSSYGRSTPGTSFSYKSSTEKVIFGRNDEDLGTPDSALIAINVVLCLLFLTSVTLNALVMYRYYTTLKNSKESKDPTESIAFQVVQNGGPGHVDAES